MSENKEPMLCQCEYNQSKGMQVMCFMCTGKKPLSYFDKVKEHDPNCSFLYVDLVGQTSYKSSSSEPGETTRDEVTMGDAWTVSKSVLYRTNDNSIGVPSQEFKFIKEVRKNGELVKSTEVTPPVVFPRIKSNDNTEGAEPVIKLTFYSGKLWYSDKMFIVKPTGETLPFPVLGGAYYNQEVKKWLPAAYEVVNPELVVGVSASGLVKRAKDAYTKLEDGDQITLPERYGIEKHYQPDSGPLVRRVSIILPEKPDNSANGRPILFNVETGNAPSVTPVEPSESQEDMWIDVRRNSHRTRFIEEMMEKFTITRK